MPSCIQKKSVPGSLDSEDNDLDANELCAQRESERSERMACEVEDQRRRNDSCAVRHHRPQRATFHKNRHGEPEGVVRQLLLASWLARCAAC